MLTVLPNEAWILCACDRVRCFCGHVSFHKLWEWLIEWISLFFFHSLPCHSIHDQIISERCICLWISSKTIFVFDCDSGIWNAFRTIEHGYWLTMSNPRSLDWRTFYDIVIINYHAQSIGFFYPFVRHIHRVSFYQWRCLMKMTKFVSFRFLRQFFHLVTPHFKLPICAMCLECIMCVYVDLGCTWSCEVTIMMACSSSKLSSNNKTENENEKGNCIAYAITMIAQDSKNGDREYIVILHSKMWFDYTLEWVYGCWMDTLVLVPVVGCIYSFVSAWFSFFHPRCTSSIRGSESFWLFMFFMCIMYIWHSVTYIYYRHRHSS